MSCCVFFIWRQIWATFHQFHSMYCKSGKFAYIWTIAWKTFPVSALLVHIAACFAVQVAGPTQKTQEANLMQWWLEFTILKMTHPHEFPPNFTKEPLNYYTEWWWWRSETGSRATTCSTCGPTTSTTSAASQRRSSAGSSAPDPSTTSPSGSSSASSSR